MMTVVAGRLLVMMPSSVVPLSPRVMFRTAMPWNVTPPAPIPRPVRVESVSVPVSLASVEPESSTFIVSVKLGVDAAAVDDQRALDAGQDAAGDRRRQAADVPGVAGEPG